MEQIRDFKGVWIDRAIWLDERLNALEKVILTEIDSLDNGEGCFASNDYLAKFCQCSERKITEAVSKLINLGYIYVKNFDGRKRTLGSRLAKIATLTSENCEPELQNLQHNNIYNNKVNNDLSKKVSNANNACACVRESYDEIIENFALCGLEDSEAILYKSQLIEFIKHCQLNGKMVTNEKLKDIIIRLDFAYNNTSEKIKSLKSAINGGYFDIKENLK